jgi:hypothetical protein
VREEKADFFTRPRWRKRTVASIAVFSVAVVIFMITRLLSGCAPGVSQRESTPADLPALMSVDPSAYVQSPSWGIYFDNLPDLCMAADVIAVGVIERVVDVDRARHMEMTRFGFRPQKVLKGGNDGELIINSCGVSGMQGTQIIEDPVFNIGERWVLFLQEGSPGNYHNFGPWGRYKVIDDRVYSINHVQDSSLISWHLPELDFNGVGIDDFLAKITEVLDDVHVVMFDRLRLPVSGARLMAGATWTLDAVLFTGEHGPGKAFLSIVRVDGEDSQVEIPMPEGMEATIQPAEFQVSPGGEYESRFVIWTSPDLQPGRYWLSVNYSIKGSITGQCLFAVKIQPYEGDLYPVP